MSRLHVFETEDRVLWGAFVASLMIHLLIFHAGDLPFHLPQKRIMEIDITNMGQIGRPGPPKAAPPAAPPKPAPKPKEWVRNTKPTPPAPIPTQPVPQEPEPPPPAPAQTANGNGEIGIGTGEGGEGQFARLPQLLNLSDLNAILQRFYPEQARADGREATVVLDIHIGPDGKVNNVDVIQSADPDFDQAAIRVAKLLRFTPAYIGSEPVAVKMRQAIQFKLEN